VIAALITPVDRPVAPLTGEQVTDLQEVGVLILPLRPTPARRVAAPEAPTTG
jgi:hypothetical protein